MNNQAAQTMPVADQIREAAESNRNLAKTIRQHGTCAPSALELVAGRLENLADLAAALAAPVVSDDAACILRDLVEALDGAFISSCQSTAAWSDQLNVAREHLAALSPGRSGEVTSD